MIRNILLSAASASSSQTSGIQDVGDQLNCSIDIAFSATPSGTCTAEGSNDGTTFSTISGTSQAVTSGSSIVYNFIGVGYRYLRATWTRTSGAGTITIGCTIKLTQQGARV